MEKANDVSLVCVKENLFVKIRKFFKNLFRKEVKKSDKVNNEEIIVNELDVVQSKTKEDIMNIYSKAKKGEYDLENLEVEEIHMLNDLIEEEIKLKAEKLKQLMSK